MKADGDWRVARVHPLAGFDRMLVAFALYPVAPILLFLLGWWISLLFIEDNQVFLGAIGGLAMGITADLVYVKRRLELAYQMPGWFWHLIYIFFSVCCFGFFMGVPVFNLVLGVPAGMFIARKARANGLSDERVKREIDAASKMTAVYILLFSLASCSFAENVLTILNYPPAECRQPQTSRATPGCEFAPSSKREGGEWFGRVVG